MSSFNTLVDDPTLPLSKEVEMKELLPNKCKSCRFWERDGKLRIGVCDGKGVVDLDYYGGETPIGGIGYSSNGEYSASMRFDQDFGCINYKIRRRP